MTRGRFCLLFAATVGALGSAQPARADQILILPYQPLGKNVPAEMTEQATVVVAKELGQQGLPTRRADEIAGEAPRPKKDLGKRKEADAPTGDPAAASRAEQLIAKGKAAVEDSEFPAAIKDLRGAVRALEDNAEAVPDLRLLAEAYLQLGVAYFRNGDEDAGDEMLAKAVHLDPERQLDESDYPNLFVRVYARTRYNVLRRPRAAIEVKAAKGAQVFFDGRNVGKAPLVLKDALPGTHWVRVERPGEPVQAKKIALKSGHDVTLELDSAAAAPDVPASAGVLAAIAANDLSREHVQQLQAAGARAGASFVVFGGIYRSETAYNLRTALVSVKDGTVGRLADVAFDLDMLSAEIEAFKLAEDVKREIGAATRAQLVTDARFPIATDLKGVRRDPAQAEAKVTTVLAAPPAPAAPEMPKVAEVEPAPAKKGRASPTSGRAPVAADSESGPVAKTREVVPKDEEESSTKLAAHADSAVQVVPLDEQPERAQASTWWIWLLVGVAAVGAASAGGYLVATGGSPDTGKLKITW